MPKKNIHIVAGIIILLVIVASFLLGWQIGLSKEKAGQSKNQNEVAQKQEEIKALQSALENFYPPLPDIIYGVSGKVIKIEGNAITIETSVQVSRFPLPNGKETEKRNIKILVTADTKITKIQPGLPPPLPEEKPLPEKVLNLSDIKIGDTISAVSTENIKGKKEVTVSQIQVLE